MLTRFTNGTRRKSFVANAGSNPSRTLLSQGSFSYLGYYDVVDGNTEAGLGRGFTFRYVSGTFRGMFARASTGVPIREFTLPGSFGGTCTLLTSISADVWNGNTTSGQKLGIWWESGENRLWSNQALDYPDIAERAYTQCISTRVIDDSNNISDWTGFFGIESVSQRAHYGGVRKVPAWFQTANSVGPYMSGFGGYTSLMASSLTPSLGPFLVFFPDPHGVYTGAAFDAAYNIPIGDVAIAADHRSGVSGTDWFSDFENRTLDRGVRATTTIRNWFDGTQITGSSATTTVPPAYPADYQTGGWWYGENGGPAPNDPDGFSRWCWGDTHNSNCVWIDNDAGTRSRHGLVTLACLGNQDVWYKTSDLRRTDREFEFHVFDPDDLADGIAGTKELFDIRPTNAWSIKSELEGLPSLAGSTSSQTALTFNGMDFDPATNLLYCAFYGMPNGTNKTKMRLYVFHVGGG